MIDQIAELCCEVLALVFLASWRTLPIFLLVAVLTLVIRKRVPARYLCWLWLIVIARLLLPWSVESTVAISSVADKPSQTLISSEEEVAVDSRGFDTFTYEDNHGESVTVALLPADATAEEQAEADAYVAKITAEELALLASSAAQQPFHQVDAGESWFEMMEPFLVLASYLIVLGLPAVAIVLLFRNVLSHVCFAWKLRSLPLVTDRATIDCLLRVCDELGAGRRPRLKEVASLHAPAMFGLFRPIVCLPAGWQEELTMQQLEWVFRHEVAHVKGRDGLLLSMATLVKSVHWFNPLSWIAVNKLQHSMERAADELATLHLNETQIREYGELLLRFAAGQPSLRKQPTVGLLAMAAPKNLQRRIESLGSPIRSRTWLRGLMAAPVIGLVAVSGLTDAGPIDTPEVAPQQVPNFENTTAQWQRQLTTDAIVAQPGDRTPLKVKREESKRSVAINVEKALQKAKELQPGIDAQKFVMTYFTSPLVPAEQRAETKIIDGVVTVELTKQKEALVRQRLSGFEQSGPWQIVTELRLINTNIRLLDQFDWSTSDSTARLRRLDRSPVLDDPEQWAEATFSLNAVGWPPTTYDDNMVEQAVSIPIRVTKISRLQSARFMHQVQKDNRSNLMIAPKFTMFNGQCGVISDMVQRPFVTDVFEIPGNKATALQPKISVFEDGWKFLVKPTVTAEEEVNLKMVFTHASIDGVKLANLPNGRGNDPEDRVTIQVPTVKSDSIAVESILNESETLLVFSPKPYSNESDAEQVRRDDGMGQVFMIRTRLISDSEYLKSFVPATASTLESESDE
ncbi:M56 family metallopeptidase [Novipirellula artificiosorum]|uniref:Regulatory protein BlaR1 n=1 Tax=Novipirellula artificiosorum TaxID=2528016 RepID=A0A5C6DRJ9_9BACT|nr:M56 family metallopeptidase [Novipirellula artificiosorum]TWU39388.1 Regulatory protein BlaR1 [Novipirellula artificiosorum]